MSNERNSELLSQLTTSLVESSNDDYEVLSLRIPRDSAAMIQTLHLALQRPVLTLLTNELSRELANWLVRSHANEGLVLEGAKTAVSRGSALDLLTESGALCFESSMSRQVKALFK